MGAVRRPFPRPDPSRVPGAQRAPDPERAELQLATLVSETPDGPGWLHEIKFDGYRMLCRVKGGRASLQSRNGKDWTFAFHSLARVLAALPVREAWLDGEVVALEPDGSSSFRGLQQALSEGRVDGLVFYAFDLLYLDGFDLRGAPLLERKTLLESLLSLGAPARVRYADHIVGQGGAFYRRACGHGLEGVVSKRKDAPHRPGRTLDWLKVKCRKRQEFVVVGFTDPGGSRVGLGALLLGVHRGRRLVYAGKVGTGFNESLLRDLHAQLRSLERPAPPIEDPPRERGVHWVEPRIVAEVGFSNWTGDAKLRHPTFLGLREDKPAGMVVRENPLPPPPGPGPDPEGVRVAGVRLTHPERVLYPAQGLTKHALAAFYESIAEWALPHMTRRLLSLVRCPEGFDKECFYQKYATGTLPAGLRRFPLREAGGARREAIYIEDLPGLIRLVQMGVLEIHPWGSRVDDLERPDRCTFDLDPAPEVPWPRVVEAARLLRARLLDLGLRSFVKTTGGKGLHVVVPLPGPEGWEDVKGFSKAVADEFARRDPRGFTSSLSKASRQGRIFIDYLRNTRGSTAVAAYSTRARAGAPVSVPVDWDEVTPSLAAEPYTVLNLPRRLAGLKRDPWADLASVRQTLARARAALRWRPA